MKKNSYFGTADKRPRLADEKIASIRKHGTFTMQNPELALEYLAYIQKEIPSALFITNGIAQIFFDKNDSETIKGIANSIIEQQEAGQETIDNCDDALAELSEKTGFILDVTVELVIPSDNEVIEIVKNKTEYLRQLTTPGDTIYAKAQEIGILKGPALACFYSGWEECEKYLSPTANRLNKRLLRSIDDCLMCGGKELVAGGHKDFCDSCLLKANKAIAEFMGATFKSEDACGTGNFIHYANFEPTNHPSYLVKSIGRVFQMSDLMYHRSWDWIMPVVVEIKKLHVVVGGVGGGLDGLLTAVPISMGSIGNDLLAAVNRKLNEALLKSDIGILFQVVFEIIEAINICQVDPTKIPEVIEKLNS